MIFRSNIARQPETVAGCVAAAREQVLNLDLSQIGSGVTALTGIGASFSAAIIVAAQLRQSGRRAFAVDATDLVRCGRIVDSIVALSHKGRSVEVVDAVSFHDGTPSLGISKDLDSPLAAAAYLHLLLANGSDSTPSSTGFTGSLAVAGIAADRICAESTFDWGQLPRLASDLLDHSGQKIKRALRYFGDCRTIDCVGSCASFGTSDMAALLIREAARIPAGAWETRQYLHGPMEAMDENCGIILFGAGRELKIARELRAAGCAVLLVTSNREVADEGSMTVIRVPEMGNCIAQAILDIMPAQILAAGLSDSRGLTDTKFRYLQTDTKIQ